MEENTKTEVSEEISPKTLRDVIVASAAGTAFEWYDFFLVGLLTANLAEHFYSGLSPAMSFIFTLLTFAIGLAFRPLGAMYFGSIGDKIGRKKAFVFTVTLMGASTFLVGILPDYETIGIWAPVLLISLRIIQGFALGGEYGGAAIYVAEHSSADKRGLNTSYIQSTAAFGLFGALGVVFLLRVILGDEAFKAWGWRLPFILSLALLIVALVVRSKLSESPSFEKLKAEGNTSKAPLKEVFSNISSLKLVLLALFGFMIAQGVTWYTSHFYIQVFLEKQIGVDPKTINIWLLIMTTISAFLYVFFGWLSDKLGRKPVMLAGMILATVSFYPGFQALVGFANPDLEKAIKTSPVTVVADKSNCSVQFNPVGKAPDGRDAFATSCDVAKAFLSNSGIPYKSEYNAAPKTAKILIGNVEINSPDISSLGIDEQKAVKKDFSQSVKAELAKNNYPLKADPSKINHLGVISIMLIFIIAATALYGPMAACLVELFPTKIRYTALSVPYHVGTGLFGGFVPATSFAIVATTGNMFSGLWYPIIATIICIIVTILFLPETKNRNINA